ncbi:putative ribosome-binding factor A, mitochondrial [Pseudophryne corroboree]|uniref:putative ribosome-binding factor A, mitochondrial n=1 Tax=Pseudophryne corroboree TaxID=495146 RepID=UPI00308149BD
MATSVTILRRFCRPVIWRDFPLFVWGSCSLSRVTITPLAAVTPHFYRCVHVSPALLAKSLIHKFSIKSKKKLWYDSPCYSRPDNQPQGLMSLMKQEQKEKRGNTVRIKALNAILYRALTGMLGTAEVSEEVFDLYIELSKVSVTFDVSVCRAYWKTSGNKDTDAEIEKVLQKYAARFRHLLITHQVLGRVPPILFLKDKEDAKIQEVEELLATLDFGDNYDTAIKCGDVPRTLDSESPSAVSAVSATSVFGIDHVELNKQIVDYKMKMKDRQMENDGIELSKQQQEQLAEIRKQKLLRKKMKKQKWAVQDYINPQDYLLSADSDLYYEEESELQEDIDDLEEEDGDGVTKLN